jgi:hypothetical protein
MVFLLKTTSFAVCESNALLLLRCNLPYGLSPNCLRSVASFDFSSELFSGLHRHFVYSELIWKKWYWTVEKFVFLVGFAVEVFMQSAWELRLVTPLVRRTFFFKSLVIGKYKQGCITCTRALTRKTAATNIDSIVWLSTMDGDLPR